MLARALADNSVLIICMLIISALIVSVLSEGGGEGRQPQGLQTEAPQTIFFLPIRYRKGV